MMNVKEFNDLHSRDFDNEAILNEIRTALKERDDLRMALETLYTCVNAMLIGLTALGIDVNPSGDDFPPRLRESLKQAHAALTNIDHYHPDYATVYAAYRARKNSR